MKKKKSVKNFFRRGFFTPFKFSNLFPKVSKNLKRFHIGLWEVGAKRPLKGVRKTNTKKILLRKAKFSKKITFLWRFYTFYQYKFSNLRPLLSIPFSQVGAKRRLTVPQKLTDGQTHTDILTYRKHRPRRPMLENNIKFGFWATPCFKTPSFVTVFNVFSCTFAPVTNFRCRQMALHLW